MFLYKKWMVDTLEQLFCIVSTVFISQTSSPLHSATAGSCCFMAAASIHSLLFSLGSEKEWESSFLSLSTRRGGCRSCNCENNVEAVRMQLCTSPTALGPLLSCWFVACSPLRIWHSGNSSPWKRLPPYLVSSGRWRLSFFSAPSPAPSAVQPSPCLLSAGVHMAEGSRGHLCFCRFVSLSCQFRTWLYFFLVFAGKANAFMASVQCICTYTWPCVQDAGIEICDTAM